ncbi:MAG: NAD(P)/FAD-dependent oxidoreductase, partial [Actinomycetota bacterium]
MTSRQTDLLVVGAGPAGSASAAWAARAGIDTLLVDAETFPRDKPCGDGLTPRAIAELDALGLAGWLEGRARNRGLRAAGFGQLLYLPWPGGSLPDYGGAAPRLELDHAIRQVALDAGAQPLDGTRAVDVERDSAGRVVSVTVKTSSGVETIRCRRLIVADGARSQLGRALGREWHRDTAYGVEERGYTTPSLHDDEWISSPPELRDDANHPLSG